MAILDIPAASEFLDASLNHLHLAFDIGIELASDLKNSGWPNEEVDPDVEVEYWRRSRPVLSNGFSLIQQSQEFFLKSQIAKVSPYLLLTRDSREWPRRCEKVDTQFSAFRMADAAELIKIFNTVSSNKLSAATVSFCEEVRRQRNTLIHFGYAGQKIDVNRLFLAILRTSRELIGGDSWPLRRDAYLSENRHAVAYTADYVGDALLYQFDLLLDFLKPAEAKAFFQFDKKARRYICPHCMNSADNERLALAQLHPNDPSSTTLFCFICEKESLIVRKQCSEKGCKSNVLLPDGTCLVCW